MSLEVGIYKITKRRATNGELLNGELLNGEFINQFQFPNISRPFDMPSIATLVYLLVGSSLLKAKSMIFLLILRMECL